MKRADAHTSSHRNTLVPRRKSSPRRHRRLARATLDVGRPALARPRRLLPEPLPLLRPRVRRLHKPGPDQPARWPPAARVRAQSERLDRPPLGLAVCPKKVNSLPNGDAGTTVRMKNKKDADALLKAAFPGYQKSRGIGSQSIAPHNGKKIANRIERWKNVKVCHKDYARDMTTGITRGHRPGQPWHGVRISTLIAADRVKRTSCTS